MTEYIRTFVPAGPVYVRTLVPGLQYIRVLLGQKGAQGNAGQDGADGVDGADGDDGDLTNSIYQAPYPNTVPRPLFDKVTDDDPYVEEMGAVGDGVTDDTVALENALNSGRMHQLTRGKRYWIRRYLHCTVGGGGLRGPRSASIFGNAADFDNTNANNQEEFLFASNAVFIYIHGGVDSPYVPLAPVTLSGFTIESEVDGDRAVNAVAVRGVPDAVIEGLEIFGFPCGRGISFDSCPRVRITKNYIHDFYSNADDTILTGTSPSVPAQMTGIAGDDNRLDFDVLVSDGAIIDDNIIEDLVCGEDFIDAFQDQSDGITIASPKSSNITVSGNKIKNTAEGIDAWGVRIHITKNLIENSRFNSIKAIHGFRDSLIDYNIILTFGCYGIALWGTGVLENKVANVKVANNIVIGTDPSATVIALGQHNACIAIDNGGTAVPPENNLITHNLCDAGNHEYTFFRRAGTGNDFIKNRAIAGTAGIMLDALAAAAPPVWHTGNSYLEDDRVLFAGDVYECPIPHTAGTFLTDLAAGRWVFDLSARLGVFESATDEIPHQLKNIAGLLGSTFQITGNGTDKIRLLISPTQQDPAGDFPRYAYIDFVSDQNELSMLFGLSNGAAPVDAMALRSDGLLQLFGRALASPKIEALGSDADIDVRLVPKGMGHVILPGGTRLFKASTTMANGAAAQLATITNGPAAGNPTKWIPFDDAGVTRYIPVW